MRGEVGGGRERKSAEVLAENAKGEWWAGGVFATTELSDEDEGGNDDDKGQPGGKHCALERTAPTECGVHLAVCVAVGKVCTLIMTDPVLPGRTWSTGLMW